MNIKKSAILAIVAVVVLGGFITAGVTHSQQAGAPFAQTNQATIVSDNSATLYGQLNPNGYQTSYYFEYGTTQSLGNFTSSQTMNGSYSQNNVSMAVSGLMSGTTYYFRLSAQNQYGTSQGNILSFSTTSYGTTNSGNVSVSTNAATDITNNSATLIGFAATTNSQSLGWFEYGTDYSNLNQKSLTTVISTSDYYRTNSSNSFFRYSATNLNSGTTYYFKAVLQNNGLTSYGQTLSFTTTGSSYYNYNNYTQPINYTYTPPTNYVYTQPVQTTPTVTYVPQYIYATNPQTQPVYYDSQPYYTQPTISYTYYSNPYAQNLGNYPNQGTYYYTPTAGSYSPLQASVVSVTSSSLASFGAILLIAIFVLLGVLLSRKRS